MKVTRRAILKSAAIAGASALFPAVVSGQAKRVVNYGGSGWLGHYPAWVGIKAGLFSAKGINVNFQSFGTSSARLGAMLSGDIDLGCTGFVSAVPLMARGSRHFSIIGAYSNSTNLEGLIAHRNIESIKSLKGKKIGTSFASTAHLLLLDLLNTAGLNPESDVTLINISSTEMAAALQTKQLDAVVSWTPQFNKILTFPDVKLLANDADFSLYKKYGVSPVPDVLIGRKDYLKGNSELVHQFYKAFSEGCVLLKEDPARCAKYLSDLTNLPEGEQMAVIKDVQWSRADQQKNVLNPSGNFLIGLQQMADMMGSYKLIEKSPKISDWIDSAYA